MRINRLNLLRWCVVSFASVGAAWGAVGDGIAFRRDGNIWYLDNGAPTQVTDDPVVDSFPSWSPDGTEIAFEAVARGTSTSDSVWRVEIATGAVTQVTDDDAGDTSPAWSPDAATIAFASSARGTTTGGNIWLVSATGGTPSVVTDDAATDFAPAWSPDGSKIAFASPIRNGTATYCIWTVDVLSGALTRITDDGGADYDADWSRDGAQIAFSSPDRGGTTDCIWIRDLSLPFDDPGGYARATDDAAGDGRPVFSPDGTQIAFMSESRGASVTRSIWVKDLSAAFSEGYTQVTDDLGGDNHPSWGTLAVYPAIDVSPAAVALDLVAVGSSDSATFAVANTGAGTLSVSGIGSSNAQYTVSPMAFDVAAGASQVVTVTFAPTVVGWETADLTISHNAPSGSTVVTASGIGKLAGTGDPLTETQIAYTSDRLGNTNIRVTSPDGTTSTGLTTDTGVDRTASWSPDGAKVIFASERTGPREIFSMFRDGSGLTQITTALGVDAAAPSLSPDGARFVIGGILDGGNTRDIYTLNADGTGLTQITTDPGYDQQPTWSPDGLSIAFASDRTVDFEVYTMSPDGTGVINLTNHASNDGDPAWSPDGSKIAFTSDRDGDNETFVMNADGSNPVQLTFNTVDDRSPTWSPDGSQIAISSLLDGDYDVYVMGADGSNPVNVSNSLATDGSPSWSPFFSATASGDATVTAPDVQGQIGGTVVVPISVTDLTGFDVIGIALDLTYDATLLTPATDAVALGDTFTDASGWQLDHFVAAPGQLGIGLAGSVGNPATGAGTLVYVTFDVAADALPGATSPLSLTKAEFNEGEVTATVSEGTFSVLTLVYGDVTGNGDVTPFDAAWVLEYVVNAALTPPVITPFRIQETAPTWASAPVSEEIAFQVADVDGDVVITAMDSSFILQHSVRRITEFPVESGTPTAPAFVLGRRRLSGWASSERPGAEIVVSLDVDALHAGEMLLEFDPRLLRWRGVSLTDGAGTKPALAHQEGEGQVALAFASGLPLAGSVVRATFEASSDVRLEAAGVVRVSRVRLNGSSVGTGFDYGFRISPFRYQLVANYPNPFNPETWIPFELTEDSDVAVRVYGLDGGLVRTLELGRLASGEYRARSSAAYWDGRNELGEAVASGVYVVELTAGAYRETRRLVVGK